MFKRFLHTYVLQFEGHWDMVCMYRRAKSQHCNASLLLDTPDAFTAEGTKEHGVIEAIAST